MLRGTARINNYMTKSEIRLIIIHKKYYGEILTEEEEQIALSYFTEEEINTMYQIPPSVFMQGPCKKQRTLNMTPLPE